MNESANEAAPDDGPRTDRILFYDGVCALCHGLVRFIVPRDRDRAFRYAPLQGETAERVRAEHPGFPRDLNSMVYLEDDRIYLRSRAIMRAARHLPFPWSMPSWFRWLPRFVTDPVYRVVARIRYRVFGQYDTCRLPTPEEEELFLP